MSSIKNFNICLTTGNTGTTGVLRRILNKYSLKEQELDIGHNTESVKLKMELEKESKNTMSQDTYFIRVT